MHTSVWLTIVSADCFGCPNSATAMPTFRFEKTPRAPGLREVKSISWQFSAEYPLFHRRNSAD
jgi:hypothetical protein